MEIKRQKELSPDEKEVIRHLWNQEFPAQLYLEKDGFDQYLSQFDRQTHFLMRDDTGTLIAWAYTFNRDQERWFSLIVDSRFHRKGLGSRMMDHLKAHEKKLNGWVTDRAGYFRQNGTPYESPLAFYLGQDFKVVPDIRYEDERLSAVKIQWIKT